MKEIVIKIIIEISTRITIENNLGIIYMIYVVIGLKYLVNEFRRNFYLIIT